MNEKLFSIKATCPYFEVNELVAEEAYLQRLRDIMHDYEVKHTESGSPVGLKLSTVHVNPTLF